MAEEAKAQQEKRNKDGLIPGQRVSPEKLAEIKRKKRKK